MCKRVDAHGVTVTVRDSVETVLDNGFMLGTLFRPGLISKNRVLFV